MGVRLIAAVLSLGLGLLATVALTATPATADTAPPAGVPATVSADPLPTWQVNGVVWASVLVGSTVYVTGNFTKARPPGVAVGGAGEVDAVNLFAYDITSGNRVASFDHTMNAQGLSIVRSPDGTRIYVAGDFTTVDGAAHGHIAAFDTATNTLVTAFAPSTSNQVAAIAASNDTVWFGGNFYQLNGLNRTRLAAVRATDGSVLPWAPTADDNLVSAMVLTPDGSRVIVGGRFATLNGVDANGMGSLDATSGAVRPWAINQRIKDAGNSSGIISLSTDGTLIYGSGFAYKSGSFEGSFAADPSTGAIRLANPCNGDTYDVEPIGGVLYTVSHVHDCSTIGSFPQSYPSAETNKRFTMAFTTAATTTVSKPDKNGWDYTGLPASSVLQWFPELTVGKASGQDQAAWTVTGNSDYVALGGEFPTVNGSAQQGLTRFAVRSKAPNQQGPVRPPAPTPPTARAMPDGEVRVAWQSAYDMDNASLTYQLYRSGTTAPIYTTTASSAFWDYPTLRFSDRGRTSGAAVTYTVKVSDPLGNTLTLPSTNAVAGPTATTRSAYEQAVTDDGASFLWRLDEPSGSVVYDHVATLDGTAGSGVTRGTPGAIVGEADTASSFDGTANGVVVSPQMAAPTSFTLEAWIKTTTTTGGKVIGYGSADTHPSGSYDRQVYMTDDGRLVFGVIDGAFRTLSTASGFNDGAWHHVIATQGSSGTALYVDGTTVGQDATATASADYLGYWRVGGDSVAGWPSAPTSDYFRGAIDDVSVYPTALTAAQARAHDTIHGTAPANLAPRAAFVSSAAGLRASFDATASSDPDGTVAGYVWSFGDGTSGSGPAPSHTYAHAGTYPVQLTVSDDAGATDVVQHAVVVSNALPTASFTSAINANALSVDAGASSDPDGTIASYSWNWGDGTTAGSGRTATHTYAASGSYRVTLTVTDSDGGTATAARTVTAVVPTAPAVLAKDGFARTVTNGWGTADTGGPWRIQGTASKFSVGTGVGTMNLTGPGAGPSAYLDSISTTSTDTTVSFRARSKLTGGGMIGYILGREMPAGGGYRSYLNLKADGTVALGIQRQTSSGAESFVVNPKLVSGLTNTAGKVVNVRFVVDGTRSTTLQAKAWLAGTPEPAAWTSTATDATAAYQAPGAVGIRTYLSTTATTYPVRVDVDNLVVRTVGG